MKQFDMRSSNMFWEFSWSGNLVVFSGLRGSNNIIYSHDDLVEAVALKKQGSAVPHAMMERALAAYEKLKETAAAA